MNGSASLFGSGHRRATVLALFSKLFAAAAIAAPGDPLGPPTALLHFPVVSQYGPFYVTPKVARDAAGNSVVILPVLDSSGVTSTLYGQHFAPDGTAQSNPVALATGLRDVARLQIAMNAAGQYAVSWPTFSSSNVENGFQVQIYQPDGTPSGSPIEIAGNDASLAVTKVGKLAVAWDTSHAIVLSWSPCSLGGNPAWITDSIKAQMFNADGTSAGYTKTIDSLSFLGGCAGQGYPSAGSPSIAVDAAGNYVVGYQKSYSYYARRFYPSGWPLTPKIQTPFTGSGGGLIASDDAGNFIVDSGVSAQLYTAKGQPSGGLIPLNVTGSYSSLAMDGNGDFVVGWSGNLISGNGTGVYVQRYTPAGSANGAPILVDSQTYDGVTEVDFNGPSLAMDATGNFAVAWTHSSAPVGVITYSNQFYLGLYQGP